MTRLGLFAWALIAAGLIVGSTRHDASRWKPRFANGEWIFTADLHVHVFPGDGALPPWEIAREAGRRGVDVVAITAHNDLLAMRVASRLPASGGAILVPGDEVTTPHFHMAAIGLQAPVDWRGSVQDVAAAVHAQGGAAIAAHPSEFYASAFTDTAIPSLDGIETTHIWIRRGAALVRHIAVPYAHAARVSPGISPVSSTDFHTIAPIGLGRTFVFAREISEAGLIDALRHGRTVACDSLGRPTGAPSLVAEVRDDCHAVAIERSARPLANRVANTCAWFGLLILVLCAFA